MLSENFFLSLIHLTNICWGYSVEITMLDLAWSEKLRDGIGVQKLHQYRGSLNWLKVEEVEWTETKG